MDESSIARNDLLLTRLATVRSLVVVCGWLVSLGILLSTLSAQSIGPLVPIHSSQSSDCHAQARRRRGRKSRSASVRGTGSYSRYSSDSQRDESIEQQQRKCRERATGDGFEIDLDLEFFDKAISGTKRKRAGLDGMLAAAAEGRIGVLYLHSLSRLARESVITMPILKRLVCKYEVRVVSISDGLDTDRDDWTMIASVMALMHERYVKELAENVRRGQEEAARLGFSLGDYRFGYSSEAGPR